jgi:hypothetical protein
MPVPQSRSWNVETDLLVPLAEFGLRYRNANAIFRTPQPGRNWGRHVDLEAHQRLANHDGALASAVRRTFIARWRQ